MLLDFIGFTWICLGVIFISVFVFASSFVFPVSPYGKMSSDTIFSINPRLGWFIMESPSLFLCAYFYFTGNVFNRSFSNSKGEVAYQSRNQMLLCFYFCAHYFNRSFIYSLSLAPGANPLHLSTMALGALYTGLNGFIQGLDVGRCALNFRKVFGNLLLSL